MTHQPSPPSILVITQCDHSQEPCQALWPRARANPGTAGDRRKGVRRQPCSRILSGRRLPSPRRSDALFLLQSLPKAYPQNAQANGLGRSTQLESVAPAEPVAAAEGANRRHVAAMNLSGKRTVGPRSLRRRRGPLLSGAWTWKSFVIGAA